MNRTLPIAGHKPWKFFNVGKAHARIRELEAQLGIPEGKPLINVRDANNRVYELEDALAANVEPSTSTATTQQDSITEANQTILDLQTALGIKHTPAIFNLHAASLRIQQLEARLAAKGKTPTALPVQVAVHALPTLPAVAAVLVPPANCSLDQSQAWHAQHPGYAKGLEISKLEAQLAKCKPGGMTARALQANIDRIKSGSRS